MTMTYEYRIVYILDLSSSLATVGGTIPTILLSGAFESLRNSLEGIAQPFALPCSATETIIMQPIIHLTVMADCSQFASNVNVIPMLAEHPTMRVFVQNVVINHSTIQLIISKLYEEFLSFQEDTASFRTLLRKKRSNFGYDLDVGTTQDVHILDTPSEPSLSSPRIKTSRRPILSAAKQRTDESRREEAYHSSKLGEVWGQGKSGANLSRVLHAGYFALKLLPPEGRSQLVLITDGAMKSNVYDNTFVRQFADEDVTCHVIQVGSEQSFIPGRNFGFVPDKEILLFLARATGGSFIYSDQCTRITLYSSLAYSDTSTFLPARRVHSADTDVPPPNQYHAMLLFRESCLTPRHSEQTFQLHDFQDLYNSTHRSVIEEGSTICNFPWDPYANPPHGALRVLRYREYALPAEFSHIIASRAREGFNINSVTFDDHNGTRISNTVSRPYDAPDITVIKKERIQIVMTLHWQPNVVIEYRIRATWLPASVGPLKSDLRPLPSTIFSRAKAPRAEIFVRTEAEFAHMLQNWDAFRRRAQMMGVVTGATYFGDVYTAPVYAKAERLKNYLSDIFEGDETLKNLIGLNARHMSNLSTAGGTQPRHRLIDDFHNFWDRLNDSENRARTRSWYDHANIDILVGNVSPYMAPKLASQYNQEFADNIEFEIGEAIAQTRAVLLSLTDFEGADGTFVRVLNRYHQQQPQDSEKQHIHHPPSQEDYFTFNLAFPPSFYEIRVRREYGRLVSLRLLFFNMDTYSRRRAVEHILHSFHYAIESSAPFNVICKRPFSLLLMRDEKHFPNTTGLSTPGTLASRRAWYMPAAMWLTSEYIVRDYLRHMHCLWRTETLLDQYHKENHMMPSHDLAFQFLCQARLSQGYQLVLSLPDCTHFYQEITLPGTDGKESLCAIQYFIWKDQQSGNITTELWMEPNCSLEQYELFKSWTIEPDRQTISQLVTFDQIHAIGRSKSRGVFDAQRSPAPHDSAIVILSDLFDVSTVIRSSAFAATRFPSPRCKREANRRSLSTIENNTTTLLHVLASRADIYRRQDTTLSLLKRLIAKLSNEAQNYALLHSFVVQDLEHIADGEIDLEKHSRGGSFWRELQRAMKLIIASDGISGTELVTDLRNMRCFVKVFDARSFVIILFPHLDTVVSGLANRSADDTQLDQIDFIIFECVRQKPLRPAKSTNTGETETLNFDNVKNIMDNVDKAIMCSVGWLVHHDDGLGETMRPQLYEGYFENNNGSRSNPSTAAPHLTERALRVAQDIKRLYCKSFFRSFYTCLLQGFSVSQDDLATILELCDESNLEIDATGFINVLTWQRHLCGPTRVQESEIHDRFMAIFRHFFEPILTTQGTADSLYYYRPLATKAIDQQFSTDEQIALLMDLVSYSQAPLLVRLECIYSRRTRNNKEEKITVPATTLPTSFFVTDELGKERNFEPNIPYDSSQWSPLATCDTNVSLNIVCLNMPRPLEDKYASSDDVISASKRPANTTMDSQTTSFSSLSKDEQEAFAETEARIQWLLTEETLHGLLKASIITEPILQYVIQKLGCKNLFVDYPTTTTMPFNFIKDATESLKTFMIELEKKWKTDSRYRFKRIGNFFYACEDAVFNMQEEEQLCGLSDAAVSILADRPSSNTSSSSEPRTASAIIDHEDLCHGLGISTLDITEDTYRDDQRISVGSNDENVPLNRRPLYWLVLVPHRRNVQIFYYSKLHIYSDILNRVKNELRDVQDTTNRLLLLRSLQETRICSKYLEPPARQISSDDESEEDEDDDAIRDAGFVPGEFSCSVVYAKRFPLHWRLQPNVALRYLTADVLRIFVVLNRPNMFVIERDNTVVYCKIHEQEIGSNSSLMACNENLTSSPVSSKSPAPPTEDRKGASANRNVPASTPSGSEGSSCSRELVLEVYGIDLPPWIEHEFVELLENRLVSQITLNEVQQFFLRNPNTRPTIADVRFILPMEKPPTRREVLRVPLLIHEPSTLIAYFKRSTLMESMHLFTGSHVTEASKAYNKKRFSNVDESPVDDGEFCLYYNCTQRVPGSSTPLELAAGQGMAGICITATAPLRTSANAAYRSNNDPHHRGVEVNPDRIHACLESEFRESSGSDIRASCRVWIDIWVSGAADADILMQYLYECFRQSLCDYFVEKTVTVDFGAAILQRALLSRNTKNVSRLMRKQFIDSILYILQTASRWKSPTVFSFEQTVQVMPWFMDDILDYINCELCNIDTSLRMTVAWTVPNHPKMAWELYQGQRTFQDGIQNHIQLVGISGLSEFVERLGSVSNESVKERRTSIASDRSSQAGNSGQRSRRSSGSSHMSTRKGRSTADDQQSQQGPSQDKSRTSSRSMSGIPGKMSRYGPRADATKHSFLVMSLDATGIAVYTYNWTESASANIFETIYRAVIRQETRNNVLANILHQKMGLFHQVESLNRVVEHYNNLVASPSLHQIMSGSHHLTPHIHIPSPKQLKNPTATPPAQPQSFSESPNNITSPTVGEAINSSAMPSRAMSKQDTSIIAELDEIINYPTVSDNFTRDISKQAEHEVDSALMSATVRFNAPQSIQQQQQVPMIRDIDTALSAVTACVPLKRREHDLLKRHGIAFLKSVLRLSKARIVQQKTQQICKKWYRHNEDRSSSSDDDKLTIRDIRAVLRSARIFHYCRTVLLFSRPDEKWEGIESDLTIREAAVRWYRQMLDTFASDYAKYLEGVGMQMVDFRNCEDTDEDTIQLFQATQNLAIDSPPVYLQHVVQGASLICEISFISSNVSVTLYTLQGRHGEASVSHSYDDFHRLEEACGRYKNFIHVISFAYDFHLRYIQQLLRHSAGAGNDHGTYPSNLDLLAVLRQFCSMHKRPASYARNRIIQGFYRVDVDDTIEPAMFYNILLQSAAPRNGFQRLSDMKASSSIGSAAVTSHDLSFVPEGGTPGMWQHTLIVCPAQKDDLKNCERGIWLEYLVLVVYQGRTQADKVQKNGCATPKPNTVIADAIDSVLLLDGYTMDDIAANARDRIDTVVAEVIGHCKRHNDWRELHSAADLTTTCALSHAHGSTGRNVESTRLTKLLGEFDHIDIREMDKNFRTFFEVPGLDWNRVFDMLTVLLQRNKSVKEIRGGSGNRRHLLLYNNGRFMDYMIHLQLLNTGVVKGWMVCRESNRERALQDPAVHEQIVQLGAILCHVLWMESTSSSQLQQQQHQHQQHQHQQ
ncbi:hypothetical protein BX666DRAFT_1922985 [Dichotomocladium elegans]|nr:hypothetical protein BX666DRAFT_1922985 [Dichotomocladium elegans]